MSSKDKKPQVSIDSLKQVVKKFKNKGFQQLTHFDLALGMVTIGFKQVCKQFGAKWTDQYEKQALQILSSSQYDISWYGRKNSTRFTETIPLAVRGDIEKIKDIIRSVNKQSKPQLVNTVDNFKRTALHLAVKEDFDVLTEFLINEGWSLNSRDRELKTPLHYCKSQILCQVLLKKGANAYVKDNKYCTPAHYAASLSNARVLQSLLKRSNVVNQCDASQKSPIFYAIFNTSQDQVNVLRVLVQNGAKINQKDIYGKTPLHYAAQSGKSRCIPFLLQKGASLEIRDKQNKTPMDLVPNQKIKKIMLAYGQSKGLMSVDQEKVKRNQFSRISKQSDNESKKQNSQPGGGTNAQIYTKQLNQVSTWIRQKFFVLMKKLQESGVKSMWHLKRPYIYTGSWAQDIDSLEDLFQTFLNVSGPEAAMRAFNILCPYEKALPTVLGRSQQAFQSFFGQNWFSNDPVQKVRNMHSQSKIRSQYQAKAKEADDLKTQLLGYRSEMQKLEGQISELNTQVRRYQKVQDDLRRQRAKNTQQYSQILQLMSQKQELKSEIQNLVGGQQKTKILSNMLDDLKSKNQDLQNQIETIKAREAASRRKCGQIFLKSLTQASAGEGSFEMDQQNLFDDDAIINLYDLLKNNPPNLQKRFKKCDKKGKGKLNVEQFTTMLQELSMLPQDVMSMHRITGFSLGRKSLSMDQFRTILENRHKNRPMWEKKLIKKIKNIITETNLSIDKFFNLIDKDGNGTIEASQLRKGLEDHNIFMNQTDWCNLFNLLDSDKSGQIDLTQLKTLLDQQKTGKLENISGMSQIQKQVDQPSQKQKTIQQKSEKQSQKQEAQSQKPIQQNNQEQIKEKDQSDKQEDKQEQASQKQSYESRQQIGKQLLQEQQQFEQEYSQQDSDQEEGVVKLNGQMKIQVPLLKLKLPQGEQLPDDIYLRFVIDDTQYVKIADIKNNGSKIKVSVQFRIIGYKMTDPQDFKVFISFYKTREFNEQNYLGQAIVGLKSAIQDSNNWINCKINLQALEYEKQDINGKIIVQTNWMPTPVDQDEKQQKKKKKKKKEKKIQEQ